MAKLIKLDGVAAGVVDAQRGREINFDRRDSADYTSERSEEKRRKGDPEGSPEWMTRPEGRMT